MTIKTSVMRNLNAKFKPLITMLVMLGISGSLFAQEVAPTEVERPMYEKMGMSPTVLAMVMILFTAILVGFVISLAGSTKNVLEFKRSKLKDGVKFIALLLGLGITSTSWSATEAGTGSEYLMSFPDSAFYTFLVLDIILVMIILYLTGIIRGVLSEYRVPDKINFFARWNKTMTDAVPIEHESSILMDHDYDGIQELDNKLPPWWKYGFYVTIVWAFGYLVYYNVLNAGPLQEQEYLAEMEEGDRAEAEYKAAHPELITPENVTLLTDASAISQGKNVFITNCQTCHMENGKGGVGPNLTDKYWIYGGDIKGVFSTVYNGAQNGMVAWKDLLPANEIQAVASYILQLDYIDPAQGGKAPQGDNIVE